MTVMYSIICSLQSEGINFLSINFFSYAICDLSYILPPPFPTPPPSPPPPPPPPLIIQ